MRREDWHARLTGYLADCRARPFAYGQHDCALFAAGAIEAMTGIDHAAADRGKYDTLRRGLARLRQRQLRDHFAAAGALFEECLPAQARPGDLVALRSDEGRALGIVQGEMVYVASATGLAMVPRTAIKKAWRI